MARTRITQSDVHREFNRLATLMYQTHYIQQRVDLHIGSKEYKVSNKLIVDGTNLWPDNMAGTSVRECYNALRLMIAGLSVAVEGEESYRMAAAKRANETDGTSIR